MKWQSPCQKKTWTSHASSPHSGMLNRKLGEVFSLMCTLGIEIEILQILQFVIEIFNLLLCENTPRYSQEKSRQSLILLPLILLYLKHSL